MANRKLSLILIGVLFGLMFILGSAEAKTCLQCKCICEWGQAYIDHEWDSCSSPCEGVFGTNCHFSSSSVDDSWCGGGSGGSGSQCPFDSTQARFHTNAHPRLEQYLTVDFGEDVKAVGVHNMDAEPPSPPPWNDVKLQITGPNGFVKNCDIQCWFKPPYQGSYTLHSTSTRGTGSKCEDYAYLTVNPPSCQSHSSYQCYDNDVYWYDSCSQKQEKKEECGDSGYTGSNYCYDNDVYKDYVDRGCSGSSCSSATQKVKQEECPNGCSGGQCIIKPQCTPAWKCDGSWKYYLNTDCSESNYNYCQYGCDPSVGQCLPKTITTTTSTTSTTIPHQTCTPEWKCDGSWQYYLNTDCSESNYNYCQYGCSNGWCLSQTTTTTIPSGSTELRIISTNVDPDRICQEEDETVELSARVELEQGNDNTLVTVRFYVEDDDGYWNYIGKDDERLDRDETRTFQIDYIYDADDLDASSHRIKFIASSDNREDIDYDYLYIRDCGNGGSEDYRIDVKSITLDPEYPKKCQTVLVNVPIELIEARSFPQNIYIKAYIDNNLEYTTTIRYYDEETRVFKFTFDTCSYNSGTHSVRIESKVGSVTDTLSKSFTLEDDNAYDAYKNHCLDIEKIWTNNPVQPDEDIRVYAKITNCGTETESIRASMEAFGMIVPDGIFTLPKGGSQEISFNVNVPENAAGTEPVAIKVWSSYASDALVKDFVVYTAIPIIEIEPVQEVEKGKLEKVKFDVINIGQVADTFHLELSGYASNWMAGMSPEITLEAGQRNTVEIYVNVPNEVENGDYQFTVSAQGSPRYAVTSTLKVVEGFKWPSVSLPALSITGLFAGVGLWLPWLLLLLLLLLLLFFLLWLLTRKKTRRRTGEERNFTNFLKFDDCC